MISRPAQALAEVTDAYLSARLDASHGYIEQLQVALRLFGEYLGRAPNLADLSKDTVLGWLRWLAKSRSPATVNSKRKALLALWRAAAEDELCVPPGKIPRMTEPVRIPIAWTLGELERILSACENLTGAWGGVLVSLAWKMGLLILWDTGCRLGSLLKAEMGHIDLDRATWLVPAENIKGRRADRIFQLHEQTVATIAASLASGGSRRLLWPFPYSRRQVWPHLRKILQSAGLPHDRTRMFHCLRRSAESHAAASRGIEWAASAVGHGVAVAKRSYISPAICPQPSLVEALPRPRL